VRAHDLLCVSGAMSRNFFAHAARGTIQFMLGSHAPCAERLTVIQSCQRMTIMLNLCTR
jgi:hypothetical protein